MLFAIVPSCTPQRETFHMRVPLLTHGPGCFDFLTALLPGAGWLDAYAAPGPICLASRDQLARGTGRSLFEFVAASARFSKYQFISLPTSCKLVCSSALGVAQGARPLATNGYKCIAMGVVHGEQGWGVQLSNLRSPK